ncbi:hypothetical protein SO802_017277 [Lithocarpus litseifolius]|uniref:Uncharacterized protein n=1 Tax=Lithocarpus litseifolius TaxID=425828 RepID=A0AAW2D2P4_9ROSI
MKSSNVSGEPGKSITHHSAAEFAATLQEIDEAINEDFEVQNANKEGREVTVDRHGKETDMEVSMEVGDTDINNQNARLDPWSSQSGEHVLFTTGWVENDRDKKGRKGGTCGTKNKIQPREQGSSRAIIVTEPRPNGTWVRMNDRPMNLSGTNTAEREGPKRKKINPIDVEDGTQEKEKRLRMDEEAKNLSMLMASEFKSVEVAKQLRREQ